MLLASPRYANRTELPLTFPGSLLDKDFTFETPVALFISRHNPGAEEVAEEVSPRICNTHHDDSRSLLY